VPIFRQILLDIDIIWRYGDDMSAHSLIPGGLPPRRVEQLERVLNGEPVGAASLAVGYKNENTGSKALADTRKRLAEAFEEVGLTPRTFVRDYFMPLMNATETKLFAHEGVITDQTELADNGIRMAAAKEYARLTALYPREDNAIVGLNIAINNIAVTE
jgi:hypothetical protein